MGLTRIPEPGLLVVGVIFADASVLADALDKLTEYTGELRQVGQDTPFDWTDYYKQEMGAMLKRSFFTAERLVPRDELADIKLQTNRIEKELAREDGSRRINLDPGLLTAENFVLVTTKNFTHRIYLRDGIFAELTLYYKHDQFRSLEWTYPDYRSEEIRSMLLKVRREYLERLRRPTLTKGQEEDQ